MKNTIKKNDTLTVSITDITDLGFGVGRVGGQVIFISDALPGDEVIARVIKVSSSFLVGRVEKYITKSSLRTLDRCSEASCRSCAYKCIPYSYEASLKEEGVRRLFSVGELSGTKCAPIITSPKETRYRNKAQYPIGMEKGEYTVGFYTPKSHRVTPVSDCPLTPRVFSDIIGAVCGYFKKHAISVYDEERGEGLLRHIYLRRGEVSGEILLTLVINGETIPHPEDLVAGITEKFPDVVGILLNVNTEATNVILGERFITLYGRDHIFDTLCGVRLKISAPAFYQVNHDCAEILYGEARRLASPTKDDTLLDLYCGAGSIGLSMARDCGEIIGIEIIEDAVKCANLNARENRIDNAHFFAGDAGNTEELLSHAEKNLGRKIKPDIIILDPPRGGCDERLVRFVSGLLPKRIVYISCNPKTLARDVVRFKEYGYTTDTVTPIDMFPGTGHVESLVCLTPKTN